MPTRITLYHHADHLSFFEYEPTQGVRVEAVIVEGYERRQAKFGAEVIGRVGDPDDEFGLDTAIARGVVKIVGTK